MRVAMGYATATLALASCKYSSKATSKAASSASRSSGKAAEALAGPAHRQASCHPQASALQIMSYHPPFSIWVQLSLISYV